MQTIQEWSEYYKSKGIYSFPSTYSINWKNWSNITKVEDTYKAIDWNGAKHLSGIAGIKGIRVVKLMGVNTSDEALTNRLIQSALLILHLPEHYPWILLTNTTTSIMVESEDEEYKIYSKSLKGREDLGLTYVIFLWKSDFLLPIGDDEVRFISDIPSDRPNHVLNANIFKCLDIFRDKDTLDNSKDVIKALGL